MPVREKRRCCATLVRVLGLAALTWWRRSLPPPRRSRRFWRRASSGPASAIFIGNSFFYYNNSLHNHVEAAAALGRSAGPTSAPHRTISGSGSDWHEVESYFRPNALGSYSFDANNNIVFNRNERLFDLAIMMDCSQCPTHPQLKTVFREYARKHSDTARKHGAKPVWFMSWAYADKPEMTAELAEAYTQAGNDNNAFVIPAGLAFARALEAAARSGSVCG